MRILILSGLFFTKSRNIRLTPIIPRPTTERPITAPPLKATFKALGRLPPSAALAVRTFAFVATDIPK